MKTIEHFKQNIPLAMQNIENEAKNGNADPTLIEDSFRIIALQQSLLLDDKYSEEDVECVLNVVDDFQYNVILTFMANYN